MISISLGRLSRLCLVHYGIQFSPISKSRTPRRSIRLLLADGNWSILEFLFFLLIFDGIFRLLVVGNNDRAEREKKKIFVLQRILAHTHKHGEYSELQICPYMVTKWVTNEKSGDEKSTKSTRSFSPPRRSRRFRAHFHSSWRSV